jgi:hypothetical protein
MGELLRGSPCGAVWNRAGLVRVIRGPRPSVGAAGLLDQRVRPTSISAASPTSRWPHRGAADSADRGTAHRRVGPVMPCHRSRIRSDLSWLCSGTRESRPGPRPESSTIPNPKLKKIKDLWNSPRLASPPPPPSPSLRVLAVGRLCCWLAGQTCRWSTGGFQDEQLGRLDQRVVQSNFNLRGGRGPVNPAAGVFTRNG